MSLYLLTWSPTFNFNSTCLNYLFIYLWLWLLFIFTVNEITQCCQSCYTKLSLCDVLAESATCTDCLLSASRCYKRQRSDDVERPPTKRSEVDEIPPSLIDDLMDLEENPPTLEVPSPKRSEVDELPPSLFEDLSDMEEDDVEPPPERSDVDDVPSSLLDDLMDLEVNPPTVEVQPSTSRSPPTKLCLFCGTELASTSRMFLCEHCHKTGSGFVILFLFLFIYFLFLFYFILFYFNLI